MLFPVCKPREDLYGIEISNGGLISFPGGVVLKDANENIIGEVGVSGGQVKQDQAVAKAGADTIK